MRMLIYPEEQGRLQNQFKKGFHQRRGSWVTNHNDEYFVVSLEDTDIGKMSNTLVRLLQKCPHRALYLGSESLSLSLSFLVYRGRLERSDSQQNVLSSLQIARIYSYLLL